MGKERHHESVTGQPYDEHHHFSERFALWRERKEARESAKDRGQEGLIGETDKLLEQAVAREKLQIDRKLLERYQQLSDQYEGLEHKTGKETRQLRRDIRRQKRALEEALRRHIDLNLETTENNREYTEWLKQMEILVGIKAITREQADQYIRGLQHQMEAVHAHGEGGSTHTVGAGAQSEKQPEKKDEKTQKTEKITPTQPPIVVKQELNVKLGGGQTAPAPRPATRLQTEERRTERDRREADKRKELEDEKAQLKKEQDAREAEQERVREAREKRERDLAELLKPLDDAIATFKSNGDKLLVELTAGVGGLTFRPQMEQLKTRYDSVVAERSRIEREGKNPEKDFDAVKTEIATLQSSIESDKSIDGMRTFMGEVKKVTEKRDAYKGEATALVGSEEFKTKFPQEAQAIEKSLEEIGGLEKEFNAATTLEAQKSALSKLEEKVNASQEYNKKVGILVEKHDAYEEAMKKLEQENERIKGTVEQIQQFQTEHPSAWSRTAMLGNGEAGFFGGLSNAWDQLRENVYHARIPFTESSKLAPDLNIEAEQKAVDRYRKGIDHKKEAYKKATTTEERIVAVENLTKKVNEFQESEEFKTLQQKIEMAQKATENAGFKLKDSWTGRLAGLFGGDLDQIATNNWPHEGKGGKVGAGLRVLGQYTLGVTSAVEGLGKWAAGMVAGAPGLLQTVPQVVGRTLKGDFDGVRAALDNNTLTATVTTLGYDMISKNIAGLIGAGYSLFDGGKPNILSQQLSSENNRFNQAMVALGTGVRDWIPGVSRDPEKLLNGYALGEMVGTVATMFAGGVASSARGLAVGPTRLSSQASLGSTRLSGAAGRAATGLETQAAAARTLGNARRAAVYETTARGVRRVERFVDPTAPTTVLRMPKSVPRFLRRTESPRLEGLSDTVTQMRTHITTLSATPDVANALARNFARGTAENLRTMAGRMGNRNTLVRDSLNRAAGEIEAGVRNAALSADDVMTLLDQQVITGSAAGLGVTAYATLVDAFTATPVGSGLGRLSGNLTRRFNRRAAGVPRASSLENTVARARANVEALLARGGRSCEVGAASAEAFGRKLFQELSETRAQLPRTAPRQLQDAYTQAIDAVRQELTTWKNTPLAARNAQTFMQNIETIVVTPAGNTAQGLTRYAAAVENLSPTLRAAARLNRPATVVGLADDVTQIQGALAGVEPPVRLAMVEQLADDVLNTLRQTHQTLNPVNTSIKGNLNTAITRIETAARAARTGTAVPDVLATTLMTEIEGGVTSLKNVGALSDDLTALAKAAAQNTTRRSRLAQRFSRETTAFDMQRLQARNIASSNSISNLIAAGENALATEAAEAMAQRLVLDYREMARALGTRQPQAQAALERAAQEIEQFRTTAPAAPAAPRIAQDYLTAFKNALKNAPAGQTPLANVLDDVIQATLDPTLNTAAVRRGVAVRAGETLESGYDTMLTHPRAAAAAGIIDIASGREEETESHQQAEGKKAA